MAKVSVRLLLFGVWQLERTSQAALVATAVSNNSRPTIAQLRNDRIGVATFATVMNVLCKLITQSTTELHSCELFLSLLPFHLRIARQKVVGVVAAISAAAAAVRRRRRLFGFAGVRLVFERLVLAGRAQP